MKYLDFTDLGSYDYFYNKYSSKIRKVASFNEYYNYGFHLANPLAGEPLEYQPIQAYYFKRWEKEPNENEVPKYAVYQLPNGDFRVKT